LRVGGREWFVRGKGKLLQLKFKDTNIAFKKNIMRKAMTLIACWNSVELKEERNDRLLKSVHIRNNNLYIISTKKHHTKKQSTM
jgi:intracellular sulfur oxidation DsrE/DsrF family protein